MAAKKWFQPEVDDVRKRPKLGQVPAVPKDAKKPAKN